MGVVHHSNYIRMFEDARVAWLRDRKLDQIHTPHGDLVFAVVKTSCEFLKPLRFGDVVNIHLQVQNERAKIHFKYLIKSKDTVVAHGDTLHVAIDRDFKISKPPILLLDVLKEEPWTEIWP